MKHHRRLLIIFGVLWLLSIGVGMGIVVSYSLSPGAAASPPEQWPTDSQIQPLPGRATLLMLAHPHCPCTRASIGELARLMAYCQGRVTATVLFIKPEGVADDWEKTDLWASAAVIPGVKVVRDDEGKEARRFHALTSGQTILYDANGHLQFSGGITSARGHAGDNDGRSAIVSLVNEGRAERRNTFVFGCSLHGTNSKHPEEIEGCSK